MHAAAPQPVIDPLSAEKLETTREKILTLVREMRPRFVAAFERMQFQGHVIRIAVPSEALREEILDNGAEIAAAIRKAKGFAIVEENKLKRVPTGFPADSEYAEMLKLKDFYIAKKITEEFLLSDDLLERTLAEFRRTQPFIAILNRAVQFAYEEMM